MWKNGWKPTGDTGYIRIENTNLILFFKNPKYGLK
jgi:hypothetical protein